MMNLILLDLSFLYKKKELTKGLIILFPEQKINIARKIISKPAPYNVGYKFI